MRDTDTISSAEGVELDMLYVRTNDRVTRQRIIADLELRGFNAESQARQEILESRFPLRINMAEKAYGAMGNVTCVAAAASSGRLISVDEFYAQYMDSE